MVVAIAGEAKVMSTVSPAITISALRSAPLKDDKKVDFIDPPCKCSVLELEFYFPMDGTAFLTVYWASISVTASVTAKARHLI
jgi:hypothetical protein